MKLDLKALAISLALVWGILLAFLFVPRLHKKADQGLHFTSLSAPKANPIVRWETI